MFGPAGLAYVYLVYGMHNCLNVVTGPDGEVGAVLLRAAEPVEGRPAMIAARVAAATRHGRPPATLGLDRLASGPGLLCAALDIDRSATGTDLCDPMSPLRLEPAAAGDRRPVPAWSPRVGVGYAAEPWASLAWRLFDRASRAVSRGVPAAVTKSDPDPLPGS